MRLSLPVVSMLLTNDMLYFLASHSWSTIQQLAFGSSSALYEHSDWNWMQADLPKHLARKVQALKEGQDR